MKKIFSVLFIAFKLISFVSNAQEVVNGPAISLDKTIHDYGTITQGANGACEFIVTKLRNRASDNF